MEIQCYITVKESSKMYWDVNRHRLLRRAPHAPTECIRGGSVHLPGEQGGQETNLVVSKKAMSCTMMFLKRSFLRRATSLWPAKVNMVDRHMEAMEPMVYTTTSMMTVLFRSPGEKEQVTT